MGTNRRYAPHEKVHDYTFSIRVWSGRELVETLLKTNSFDMAIAAFEVAPKARPGAELITLQEFARVMRSHPPEVAQPWLARKPGSSPPT
ncbi:MAG: hypothetical protein J0H94_11895 [Rhizobiales bacterium]|nr:hypothetical protein [Hyphomicrobiales bacterium]